MLKVLGYLTSFYDDHIYPHRGTVILVVLWVLSCFCSYRYGYDQCTKISDAELGKISGRYEEQIRQSTARITELEGVVAELQRTNREAADHVARASEHAESAAKDIDGVIGEMRQYLESE